MKAVTISDSQTVIPGLQEQIRRSAESRYEHRLHAVLLVAQGMTCPAVARLLGDSPRIVQYWVHGFQQEGLSALVDADRPGRPKRLSNRQMQGISAALRNPPEARGLSAYLWDGKTLSAFIQREYGIDLGVRQCQRLFGHLGFRLRKPWALIARADAQRQKEHLKNSRH